MARRSLERSEEKVGVEEKEEERGRDMVLDVKVTEDEESREVCHTTRGFQISEQNISLQRYSQDYQAITSIIYIFGHWEEESICPL